MYSLAETRRRARREASSGAYNLWGRGSSEPGSKNRPLTDAELGLANNGVENPVTQVQTAPEAAPQNYRSASSSDTTANGTTATLTNGGPVQRKNATGSGYGKDIEKTEEPESLTPTGTTQVNDHAKQPAAEKDDTTDTEEEKMAWHKRMYKKLVLDDPIPFGQQLKAVLFPKWYTINWLLIAAPVGIALNFTKVNPLAIFIVNFVAIIPLAAMLSFATEELALRVGEVLGGLLNASFGNAVELIVGVIALAKKEIIIVQTSLIGSMLSNLLLVLGMCFFFGGLQRVEQFFNETVAQTAASLLALAVGSLIIPTAYTWSHNFDASKTSSDEQLSRGTAILLLLVYAAYLIFQLKSHREMYNAPSQKVAKRHPDKNFKSTIAQIGGFGVATSGGHMSENPDARKVAEEEEEAEEPQLTALGAVITLCVATALIGVCAEFLVDSINAVTCQYHVSQYFVGLILLPIVGNAAEHATAVTVAVKDKMDLAIGVAVGSSMQIALLVLPLMVVIGWGIHSDMTLLFDNFQIAVLFVSVILVNYLIADGKSHWLEGVLLMVLYVIISLSAWFYPESSTENNCAA